MTEFVPLRTLGQGSFGAVLLVRKRSAPNAGRAFAMKIMDKEKMIRKRITESARVEKEILRSARHPCLVRLRYAFQSETRLFLVMDYYQGGSLEAHLDGAEGRTLGGGEARFVAGELAAGLAHLHHLGVIHRDLKPANVLLDLEGHSAIADYGLAVALDTQADAVRKRSFVGTLSYMAPEFLKKDALTYDERVDWWAFGCIVFEMRAGHTPFENPFPKRTPPRDLFVNIIRKEPPKLADDADATDLVHRLLAKQQADRPKWKKIKKHAFFCDIDFAKLEKRGLPSPLARSHDSVDDDGDHSDDDDDEAEGRREAAAPPPPTPGSKALLEGEADALRDAVQVDVDFDPPAAAAGDDDDDDDDEPDLTRPTLHIQLTNQYSRTQKLMSFFIGGDATPAPEGRADLFAGFGYRASEDNIIEVAATAAAPEPKEPTSPTSPGAGRWWFSRKPAAPVDAADL